MKIILFISFLFLSFVSYNQLEIVQPQIYYLSSRIYENCDWMKVGNRVLFAQECSPDLPPQVPTGIVFFEKVSHQKEQFSMSVEFKDTVIVAVTYYFAAKQTGLLKTIGYPDVTGRGSAVKGQWTCILNEPTRHTVIVGDRTRIVVVQTLGNSLSGDQSGD